MTTKTNPAKLLFCVVYRTGGTVNFKWHRSVAMTKAEAEVEKTRLERMGYKAMTADYQLSMAIGLPDTF